MKKILLCIMDGVGLSDEHNGNAFYNAKTPNINNLIGKYGLKKIEASGKYVGLPNGQMGNSEVGHLNIGAGRIFYQPLVLLNNAIKNKSFFKNDKLLSCINHVNKNGSAMHVMGMLSDGCVHSSIEHFKAILKMCSENKIKKLYFHIFTDGRDTYYNSSKRYLDELQKEIDKYSIGTIATICGRYYGMDRDNRWNRVQKAYDCMVNNIGEKFNSYGDAIDSNYNRNTYDEFINPSIIDENGMIKENDGIIWANFRPDRAWEILYSLTNQNFEEFHTIKFKNIYVTTLMEVSKLVKCNAAFKEEPLNNTLGVYLSKNGLKQLRIAETEKYAHVTYFFDGLVDKELTNCKRILVPSPKVETYDLEPKMSASKITNILLDEMDNNYNFILLNFANGDMVGHTGNYDAAITAVEEVDKMIGKLYEKCIEDDYLLIITADHGNCETMIDNKGQILTKHTNNKVPFIVCKNDINITVEKLADIAPFILNLMNLPIPDEMQ